MQLTSKSFEDGGSIPEEFAFAKPDPTTHASFAGNKNPGLSWGGAPEGTRSFVISCTDPDAPTVPDDVNQEGRSVPKDLPRGDFQHWILVDVPADCTHIEAGACSDGVTAHGKQDPPGPPGSRQGENGYTGWFADDAEMAGHYFGYDGPAPPWNDERVHRYRFTVHALDLERCPVEGAFTSADVFTAIQGHVLAEASLVGTYTQNPKLR